MDWFSIKICLRTVPWKDGKNARDSFAFKWADEIRETTLREIEWSPSRTGLINPVAIFKTGGTGRNHGVQSQCPQHQYYGRAGTSNRRYHSVYAGRIWIIPQIAENLTRSSERHSESLSGLWRSETKISEVDGEARRPWSAPIRQAKQIKAFALFVSRDAMNLDGMSEATLEKFIACGFIKDFDDLFHLDRYEEQIKEMDGFGEKSYQKFMQSVEAPTTTLPKLIYSLGIPGIGLANAK